MSKEHLSVALALSVPVCCVITKVDSTPAHVLEQTVKQLAKILKSPGCRKQPVFVKDVGMACELAKGFVAEKACPIFLGGSKNALLGLIQRITHAYLFGNSIECHRRGITAAQDVP